MLSSLQDITGLIPGLFQRGGAAAAEAAGRGPERAVIDVGQGRHGGDRLSLSPRAQAAEQQSTDGREADAATEGAAEGADGTGLLGQAGGFVRKALETIRHDLGKALQAFGFDSDAIQNFTKAFVEPALGALKEGLNFTAELSFAAFSQVTTLSSNGDFSQSTSLVAQSLSIEVNQDTGEVSVSLARLSFEQQVQTTQGGGSGQQPLLVIDPDDLATPQELAAEILASGEAAVDAGAPAGAGPTPEPAEGNAAEPAAPAADLSAGALKDQLAALRERLAEEGAALQTRLTIHSITRYQNDKGETITRLLLDAQLRIAGLADDATAQVEARSLDLTA